MLQEQREKLVSSIIAGYHKFKNLKVVRPSYSIEYESNLVYEDTYNEAISNEILTSQSIVTLLIEYDIWSFEKEFRFSEIPKLIDDLKLELYENRIRSDTVKALKTRLEALRTEYSTLFSTRHSFDSYTAEGIANFSKVCHIIRSCTFRGEKLYRFNGEATLEELIYSYQKNYISEEILREIGRTDPWNSVWSVIKSGVKFFQGEITDEQRRLIRISNFYDSLRSSPDCPPDFVIEDDDMLDGYLIFHKKERDKETNQNDIEGTLSPKVAECSEIYVVCENQDDAQKVYNLNSPYAKAAQGARDKALSKTGRLCEADLPDIKKKLQMEMAKAGM